MQLQYSEKSLKIIGRHVVNSSGSGFVVHIFEPTAIRVLSSYAVLVANVIPP